VAVKGLSYHLKAKANAMFFFRKSYFFIVKLLSRISPSDSSTVLFSLISVVNVYSELLEMSRPANLTIFYRSVTENSVSFMLVL
jgi:hypothetical protein